MNKYEIKKNKFHNKNSNKNLNKKYNNLTYEKWLNNDNENNINYNDETIDIPSDVFNEKEMYLKLCYNNWLICTDGLDVNINSIDKKYSKVKNKLSHIQLYMITINYKYNLLILLIKKIYEFIYL